MSEEAKRAALAAISDGRVLELEQGAVRIPSPTFEEGPVAEYFAEAMRKIGLEVTMIEVEDPFGSGKRSRQPVGILRGTGGGPSLAFNGHMDHNPVVGTWERDPFSGDYENGWVFGRGCQDDKGGIVSSITAAEALVKAKVRLKGDVMICPVMGHKSGAIGTRELIKRGYVTDYCINTENSGNGIANYCVGVLKIQVHTHAIPTHFHSPKHLVDIFLNPNEQLAYVIQAISPSVRPIKPGGWLTFEPHHELSDYPQLTIDQIRSDSFKTGKATMEFHIRTVPGMTAQTVRADMERLLARLAKEHPNFRAEFDIPPKTGQYAGWDMPPMETSRDAPLTRVLAAAHERVNGKPPVIGADPRRGAVGDGNVLAAHGIQTVLYGPGDIDIFPQWPTPDERVLLKDLVDAAKVFALTMIDICQVS